MGWKTNVLHRVWVLTWKDDGISHACLLKNITKEDYDYLTEWLGKPTLKLEDYVELRWIDDEQVTISA
jgi:hypothetical protein